MKKTKEILSKKSKINNNKKIEANVYLKNAQQFLMKAGEIVGYDKEISNLYNRILSHRRKLFNELF